MGQPCKICLNSDTARVVVTLLAEGLSDQAISDRLGGGIGRMSVQRHRKAHIEGPARAVVAMANKGADAAAQRAQVMTAAQVGDPAAFLALAAIVADLKQAQDRLERMADTAEQSGQGMTVATLTGQQLRAAELRAKMGGVFGGSGEAAASGVVTSPIQIIINGRDMMTASGPVIDGEAAQVAPATPGGLVTVQLGD